MLRFFSFSSESLFFLFDFAFSASQNVCDEDALSSKNICNMGVSINFS